MVRVRSLMHRIHALGGETARMQANDEASDEFRSR